MFGGDRFMRGDGDARTKIREFLCVFCCHSGHSLFSQSCSDVRYFKEVQLHLFDTFSLDLGHF